MKNINEMTDLEMAEEIYELENKLPRIKVNLEKGTGNKDKIKKEYDSKLQRYNLLKDNINYQNINFKVNAKLFGENLIQKFNAKRLVKFGVVRDGDKKSLGIQIEQEIHSIMALDISTNYLADVELDLSSHYLNKQDESEFLKNLSRICGEKVLHQTVYETLKNNQHTLLFAETR